jgi:hypothetical protein
MNDLDFAIAELPDGRTSVIFACTATNRVLMWFECAIALWSDVFQCLKDMTRDNRNCWLDNQMADVSDLVGGVR